MEIYDEGNIISYVRTWTVTQILTLVQFDTGKIVVIFHPLLPY